MSDDGGWGPPGIPWTEPAPDADECDGLCVMGNDVMPGGGYYDIAAYAHPDCPRHGDPVTAPTCNPPAGPDNGRGTA